MSPNGLVYSASFQRCLVIATFHQRMAPYSHVLDVINLGLDCGHKVVHMLLWNNRNHRKTIWDDADNSRQLKMNHQEKELPGAVCRKAAEKRQRWNLEKIEKWVLCSSHVVCLDSVFLLGFVQVLLIIIRVRPLHSSPRYVTRYIRTSSWRSSSKTHKATAWQSQLVLASKSSA